MEFTLIEKVQIGVLLSVFLFLIFFYLKLQKKKIVMEAGSILKDTLALINYRKQLKEREKIDKAIQDARLKEQALLKEKAKLENKPILEASTGEWEEESLSNGFAQFW